MTDFIPWPRMAPPRFNGGALCDMLIGPCACGATHTAEEIATSLMRKDSAIEALRVSREEIAKARDEAAAERDRLRNSMVQP